MTRHLALITMLRRQLCFMGISDSPSLAPEPRQCYYMGISDSDQGTAGGVKREISGSLARGINAKRLCTRLKKKDGQMCELRYDKKFDPKTVRAF